MIRLPKGWTVFSDAEEKLLYLKKHRLTPKNDSEPNQLFYHDDYCGRVCECTVVGFVDETTTVIQMDGVLHRIHTEHLLEMQAGKSGMVPKRKRNPDDQIALSTDGNRYFVFDVETPNYRNDRICAMGIVILENGEVLEEKEYLVNPEVSFDGFNIRLTGIGPDKVRDAPTFPQLWREIGPKLEDCILVAHNAPFDLGVLGKTAAAYQIDLPPVAYLCTVKLSRRYLPELPHHRLNDLCDYYGIALEHHQAGSDASACAAILMQLLNSGAAVTDVVTMWRFEAKSQPHEAKITRSKLSDQSRSLNQLLELLNMVAADGVLTEQEAVTVSKWIESHKELEGNYPFDRAFDALRSALDDGILDPCELDALLELFHQLADPVAQADHCDEPLSLSGKLVCLTGEFVHGKRSDIAAKLQQLGAVVKNNVVKKLDYLIVGGLGSDDWVAENYGTKVKKAMELQAAGAPVHIMREADLFSAMEACYGTEKCCIR